MALYLGNQKVSLRSGQDPTFDYGFDSNGRLVFANKNATEINNFLNYDSSYSEILDLSNLSKMEKVAVNGTADRKMEGLKGLLVSPNSPFTGSSPQINASYTGLSKSALVSLFESAPYNVGYEKVGNPTIVDGVASGFSNSDYLITSSQTEDITTCEWNLKFNTLTIPSANGFVLGYKVHCGVIVTASKKIRVAWEDSTSTIVEKELNYVLSDDTDYVLNCIFNNTNSTAIITLKNAGGTTLITETYSDVSYNKLDNYFWIGMRGGSSYTNNYWRGSIDLNETYIKVNGVPWFGPGVTKNLVPDGTVVGDVIVKDGVASGFSDSSYLLISKNETLYGTNDFIVASSFIPSSLHTGAIFCMTSWYLNGIQVNSNGTIQGTIHASSPTSKYYTVTSSIHYVANTKYWVQLIKTNSTLKIRVSTDNINFTEDSIALDGNDVIPMTNPYQIGVSNPGVFNGSIDLNNTYIKVGSDYFYRGMVPMTKTCSIIGATGTADLTQEDKNIILNKGWSLTVQ